MRIIVGLGNPGPRFRCTRHNIGFRCIDLIARQWDIRLSERRPKAVLGRGRHVEQDVVLAKPRTYMNNSGEGVAYLLTRFAARPQDLIIIYDEMALPVGKLRLRPGGSDAGHNGMRSIIAALGTTDFPRIRLGIARPSSEVDQVAHVIGGFTEEESPIVSKTIKRAVKAIDCLLTEGIDPAMNQFN